MPQFRFLPHGILHTHFFLYFSRGKKQKSTFTPLYITFNNSSQFSLMLLQPFPQFTLIFALQFPKTLLILAIS